MIGGIPHHPCCLPSSSIRDMQAEWGLRQLHAMSASMVTSVGKWRSSIPQRWGTAPQNDHFRLGCAPLCLEPPGCCELDTATASEYPFRTISSAKAATRAACAQLFCYFASSFSQRITQLCHPKIPKLKHFQILASAIPRS